MHAVNKFKNAHDCSKRIIKVVHILYIIISYLVPSLHRDMEFHINVVMLCAQIIHISTKEPSSKMFQPRNTNAVFKKLQNNNGQPRPVAVDGFNFFINGSDN